MSGCEEFVYVPSRATGGGLTPISSGEERCRGGHFWGPGVRGGFLIHYIISGKGTYYCGPNKYELKKGQAFIIFPDTVVKYQASELEPWHYAWVSFRYDGAEDVKSALGLDRSRLILNLDNGAELLNVIRRMPKERGAELREIRHGTSAIYEFLSLLVSDSSYEGSMENCYFKAAARYIKAHYTDSITIESIAAHVGVGRKYLFALFKKYTGISPKEYLIDYRIKKACALLENRELSVCSVAYSVGYSDSLAFSKMFKAKTGLSPKAYRNIGKK